MWIKIIHDIRGYNVVDISMIYVDISTYAMDKIIFPNIGGKFGTDCEFIKEN